MNSPGSFGRRSRSLRGRERDGQLEGKAVVVVGEMVNFVVK